MTWVYLDDGFPEHPKTVRAGGDAAWLFVCGLAYCNRRLTSGRIPKEQVGRLSDRKQPMKLAARLVAEGMWLDKGDHFIVHDYDQWQADAVKRALNATTAAAKRREKATRAANIRHHGNADGSPPPDDAQAPPEHEPSNGQALLEHEPSTCLSNAVRNAPHTPRLSPVVNPPPEHPVVAATSRVVEEPQNGQEPPDLEALVAVAIRQMAEAEAATNPNGHGPGLTAHIAKRIRTDHGDGMLNVARRDPTLTPETLVLLTTSATHRATWEAQHTGCDDCNRGWIEHDDGTVEPCPACRQHHTQGAR